MFINFAKNDSKLEYMKKLLLIFVTLIITSLLSCCNGGGYSGYSYNDTIAADSVAVPAEIATINVPISFEPVTPLSESLKQANLEDLLKKKYYSFQDPKKRKKHKKVLHNRINNEGVIDLTQGGPLTYEEEWELVEQQSGHSLRMYFLDAANYGIWGNTTHKYFSKEPEFKTVSPSSNLAKVFFIDNFEQFVEYNMGYCSRIISRLEELDTNSEQTRINALQKMYE